MYSLRLNPKKDLKILRFKELSKAQEFSFSEYVRLAVEYYYRTNEFYTIANVDVSKVSVEVKNTSIFAVYLDEQTLDIISSLEAALNKKCSAVIKMILLASLQDGSEEKVIHVAEIQKEMLKIAARELPKREEIVIRKDPPVQTNISLPKEEVRAEEKKENVPKKSETKDATGALINKLLPGFGDDWQ